MQTIDKAVTTKENRFMSRVIRQVTKLRRLLNKKVLLKAVETYVSTDSPVNENLVAFVEGVADDDVMQIETPAPSIQDTAKSAEAEKKEKEEAAFQKKLLSVPEVESLVQLLVTIYLLDKKYLENAISCASSLIQRAQSFNRRTMDQILSRGYFYWARCMELTGKSSQIRNELLAAYRTTALKHDQIGQATLLNLLLRNYLEFNLYEQADTLMRKTTFPEGDASNNQLARCVSTIETIATSVTLLCSASFLNLQQAARKAPQQSALGFRKTVYKFSVIVQLLLGEIPDRSTFSQKGMIAALKPYLQICQAVRIGDLGAFHRAMQEHGDTFKADKTYSLIVRLRHNVIKTGLKKINTAYSNISLEDVCAKLCLESVEDTRFIVAKCIQDGVIDATIDHATNTMMSKANLDIYTTSEPQMQLHKRVAFCLDMHNQAVKAMRYAENTKTEWESAEERRERMKQEEERMNSMDSDDDF
eukprot:361479-Hanusia_phi.AAC.3